MSENIASREVQRRDDPFGIPACFYWTMDEVADWVESIGYGKYKENFRSNFINGRRLLTVDACVLPRMGITHFGDILKLTKAIECVQSYRIPFWEKLPLARTPHIYFTELKDTPPGSATMKIHNVDLPSREDRFTRAGVSYPWSYLQFS